MRCLYSLVAAMLFASSGCIIIPMPHAERPVYGSRKALSEPAANVLNGSAASRADVLCALGEPDLSWENDRVFVYRWATSDLSILWAAGTIQYADGGVWESAKHNFVFVEFDDAGRVTRWEERGLPPDSTVESYQKRFWRAW